MAAIRCNDVMNSQLRTVIIVKHNMETRSSSQSMNKLILNSATNFGMQMYIEMSN